MKSCHSDLRRLYVYVTLISCVFLSNHVRGLPAMTGEAAASTAGEEDDHHDNRNFVLDKFNNQLQSPDGKEDNLLEPVETDDDEAEVEENEELDQRERMEMNEKEGQWEEKYVGGQEVGDEEDEEDEELNEESKVLKDDGDDDVQTISDTHAKEEGLLPHAASAQNEKEESDGNENQPLFNLNPANQMDIKEPSVREDENDKQETRKEETDHQHLDFKLPETGSNSVTGQPAAVPNAAGRTGEDLDVKQGIPFKLEEGQVGDAESRFQFRQNPNDVSQPVNNPGDADQRKVEPQESHSRPAAAGLQNFDLNMFQPPQIKEYKAQEGEQKTAEKPDDQNRFYNQPPLNNLPPVVEGNQEQPQGPAGRGTFDHQTFANMFKTDGMNLNNVKKQEPVSNSNLQNLDSKPVMMNPSQNVGQNGVSVSQNAIAPPSTERQSHGDGTSKPVINQIGVARLSNVGQPQQSQGSFGQPFNVNQPPQKEDGIRQPSETGQPPIQQGGFGQSFNLGQNIDRSGQPLPNQGGAGQPSYVGQPGGHETRQPSVNQGGFGQSFSLGQNLDRGDQPLPNQGFVGQPSNAGQPGGHETRQPPVNQGGFGQSFSLGQNLDRGDQPLPNQGGIAQPSNVGQPGQPPVNPGGFGQSFNLGQNFDRADQHPPNQGGTAQPSNVGQPGLQKSDQPPPYQGGFDQSFNLGQPNQGGLAQPSNVGQPGVNAAGQPMVNQREQGFQAVQNEAPHQDAQSTEEDKASDVGKSIIDDDTQDLMNQNQDFQLDNEEKNPLDVNKDQGQPLDFINDEDDLDEGEQESHDEDLPDDGDNKPSAQYSEDGYLDAPSDNLDGDRGGMDNAEDKPDDDYVDNSDEKNFDENDQYGENNDNLNNQKIIDDNNEPGAYNGDQEPVVDKQNTDDQEEEEDKEDDYDYDDNDDDYTLNEKNDDDNGTLETTTDEDDWFSDRNEEDDDNDDDDDDDEIDDVKTDDYLDQDEEEDMDFRPGLGDRKPDNTFYYNNRKPVFKEGVVEYKLMNNHSSMNTPSSMVLFYTWIILVVLIAVVTLSAFRYRCKGMFSSRTLRNGRNGRNGEENKRLLDNVYA